MRKRIAGYIGVRGTSTLGLTTGEWSCVRKQAIGRRGGEQSIVEDRKRYSEGVRQDSCTLQGLGTGMIPVSGGRGVTDLTGDPSSPEASWNNLLLGWGVSTYLKGVDKGFP
jgi:hypothetical protein